MCNKYFVNEKEKTHRRNGRVVRKGAVGKLAFRGSMAGLDLGGREGLASAIRMGTTEREVSFFTLYTCWALSFTFLFFNLYLSGRTGGGGLSGGR